MDDKEIRDGLLEVVTEKFEVDKEKISDSSRIKEDLGADSLDSVELIMAIEEKFGVNIPDEDAESLITVSDIINYIKNNADSSKKES